MDNTTTVNRNTNDEALRNPESLRTGTGEGVEAHARRQADDDGAYLGPQAEGAAAHVGRRVDDAAAFVGHKAEDAARFVGQKTEDAETAMGTGLRSLGQNVRKHGPDSGIAGEATSAVADTLDSGGRYLQEEGIKDVAEDVTNLIRRNPIPALLVAIGAGFLIGRAMTVRN